MQSRSIRLSRNLLSAVPLCGLALCLAAMLCHAGDGVTGPTNVAGLRGLTRLEMNRGRPFSLTGIVTLVDDERRFFVVQDSSGAIAVHPSAWALSSDGARLAQSQPATTNTESFEISSRPLNSDIAAAGPAALRPALKPGERISLEAESGTPYVVGFPEYPYNYSGTDIQTNFEAPSNWGDFHLTRMSGYLHPPVTGEYTFWIASDNSSELWLSTDEDPKNVRMVALIRSGSWVNPREWSRYPSQRSDPVRLEAGRAYYIEAFTEQVELDEHLAVAWRGPGMNQSIIEGRYLTPWKPSLSSSAREGRGEESTVVSPHGILREYWTNFTSGSLAAITSDRPAEFGVSAGAVRIRILETNTWPEPVEIDLARQLSPENNYRWVRAEAQVAFIAAEGGDVTLELTADQNRTWARVTNWREKLPSAGPNLVARVEGVCEGAYGPSGTLMPGTIRVISGGNVAFSELPATNGSLVVSNPIPVASSNPALGGYFSARGVVTFNGRVLGRDYLVVQDNNAGVYIAPPESPWPPGERLLVGDSVDIGGTLLPSRFAARLRPRVVNLVGRHTLPAPVLPPSQPGPPRYRDGQWTEIEGVARAVQPNGTLLLKRTDDSVAIWLAGAETDDLEALVDCTLRARGVVSLESPESPLLLAPSRSFVQIVEPACTNLDSKPISTLKLTVDKTEVSHRVRVAGVVTYSDEKLLFVQDDSGAVRVQLGEQSRFRPGDFVEVIGFPEQQFNSIPALIDSRARKLPGEKSLTVGQLDLNAPLRDLPNLALVRVKAHLLAQKESENGQTLEVQAGQRVFEALLAQPQPLPQLQPGSLLELTGVCILEMVSSSDSGHPAWESSSIGAARLLLRGPADVVVLRGPPWWSWKKAAALIALLLILLTVTLLRVHLLRRRFERQQAARLAFARQLLENQESERRRIAANLHDTLGQNLLAIKNQTHLALQSAGDSALQRRLEDISGTVLNAIEEVRQITHDLRPYQLDRLGLSQSLRALVRKVAETCPIELASHVDNIDGLFPKDSEINIYRIVQEGINNVVKHSQATEAAVVLKAETGALRISIRDNGRGLAQGQTADEGSATGFGLSGIRERARIMNGHVEVDAPPGQGFNLKIEIPLSAISDKPASPNAIQTQVANR